jgi:hypothetical protein
MCSSCPNFAPDCNRCNAVRRFSQKLFIISNLRCVKARGLGNSRKLTPADSVARCTPRRGHLPLAGAAILHPRPGREFQRHTCYVQICLSTCNRDCVPAVHCCARFAWASSVGSGSSHSQGIQILSCHTNCKSACSTTLSHLPGQHVRRTSIWLSRQRMGDSACPGPGIKHWHLQPHCRNATAFAFLLLTYPPRLIGLPMGFSTNPLCW